METSAHDNGGKADLLLWNDSAAWCIMRSHKFRDGVTHNAPDQRFIRVQATAVRILKEKNGRFSLEVAGLQSIEKNPQHNAEWFPIIGPWRDPPVPTGPISSAGCVAQISIYTPWPPIQTLPNPGETDTDRPGGGDDGTIMDVSCVQGSECERSCVPKVQQTGSRTDVWCSCE